MVHSVVKCDPSLWFEDLQTIFSVCLKPQASFYIVGALMWNFLFVKGFVLFLFNYYNPQGSFTIKSDETIKSTPKNRIT